MSAITNEKQTSSATIVLPGSVPVASPQSAGARVRSLFGGTTGEKYGCPQVDHWLTDGYAVCAVDKKLRSLMQA